MKHTLRLASCLLTFAALVCSAEDAPFQRAKLELLVEQAGEMLAEANQKGSVTHTASHRYYFGLVYGSGTNLLARKDSPATTRLQRKYLEMLQTDYDSYTKIEKARSKAAATGSDTVTAGRNHVVKNGSRHRAKRIANAEKLGDKELMAAIKKWETFAAQLMKTR